MKPLFSATKQAIPVLWTSLALVLLGIAPAVARADVILGNLGTADGNNLDILDFQRYGAASFTMKSQD